MGFPPKSKPPPQISEGHPATEGHAATEGHIRDCKPPVSQIGPATVTTGLHTGELSRVIKHFGSVAVII